MKYFIFLCLITFLFLLPGPIRAIVDPNSTPNNKVGIHIIDQTNIADATRLVNSTNGDWGYVTIVIPQNERDHAKWQEIFDSLRRNHLIPIIRLATHVEGTGWVKPTIEDARVWADFLGELNWVTTNRYVVLFNEPNHSKEWGGEINPREYARILKAYSEELKKKSNDFFILPAGLDASAPNGTETMDEELFLEYMNQEVPGIFNTLDGWTSHAYPNPNFSGSPFAQGRRSIKTYTWEMEILKKYGLTKNLPIFITETGWAHTDDTNYNSSHKDPDTVAQYLQHAYEEVWTDQNLIAVTPFVLNYPQFPFGMFSWKRVDNTFYPQYFTIMEMPKTKGKPQQLTDIAWKSFELPSTLVTDSSYVFELRIQNEGQSIFEKESDFDAQFTSDSLSNISTEFTPVEPDRNGPITIRFNTPANRGKYTGKISITHSGKELLTHKYSFTLIEPPSLSIKANAFFKPLNDELSTILIYDQHERVVGKYENLKLKDGKGSIANLRNIAVGERYRIVLKKPYYLPRQIYVSFTQGENSITFEQLLPFDPNLDGTFSFQDYMTLISHPQFLFSLIF